MAALQKMDLHLHTVDDPMDSHIWHTGEELIDKAARLDYTVLAITLHNRQFENHGLRNYAAERGILLLPGVEQDVEGSHVLLLNFPRRTAERIRTFADLRRAREEFGAQGLVVAAHPFYPNSVCLKEKLLEHRDLFDAVEASGFYHRFWDPNRQARASAQNLGLPLVGNSDTHTLEQFGTIWTEVACEAAPEAVVAALKQGRGIIRGRSLRVDEMARITYKVVVRGYMPWIDYKKKRCISAGAEGE